MKFLFDLFPVILFFATFKLVDIYAATAVAIVATLLQIGWVKWQNKKVDSTLVAGGVIMVIFGGATLLLHDETFIKWKPTVLYWMFGLVLLVTDFFWNKNLIQSMMQEKIELPTSVWRSLNYAWAGFFILLGVINLFVAYYYTTDFWVNFKLFGTTGLMLVFIVIQSLLLSKYIEKEENQ